MVLSRALSLAAVTLVAGCCAIGQVRAQENLDAGKSPSQIFSGTCTACHKSARGLLKTVSPGSLQGFLRQHYTTSPEMAGVLASYLMSNGATDTRYGDKQKGAKDGKQTRSEATPESKPESKPVARPEAGAAEGGTEHTGHKRMARPSEPPEVGRPAAEGQVPQAAGEPGPEGRKAKRLSKRGKPSLEEEVPKVPDRPRVEPPKEEDATEPANSDSARIEPARPEPAKTDTFRSEPAKPEEIAKPVESARPVESPAQSANVNEALPPSLRRDPVPSVTPAPTVAAPAPSAAAVPLVSTPAPPSVTASAPPPPAEPVSPPEPPISH